MKVKPKYSIEFLLQSRCNIKHNKSSTVNAGNIANSKYKIQKKLFWIKKNIYILKMNQTID